jgi:CubicO group peptidase (beta-lactamase class C family)
MFQPDPEQLAHPASISDRMQHYATPGVSIAVIHDWRIETARAYGVLNAGTGVPVTTDSLFEAASTSKFITAVMALRCVQDGRIALDGDVNRFLRSWKVPDGELTREHKVTLRRLLTHQAGLPATNYGYDETMGLPTLLDVLRGVSPAWNRPAVPELVPGSRWQYSNVAYDLIQLLLEDVTGIAFQDLAQQEIFSPLGMDRSSFAYPLDPTRSLHEAIPHDAQGIPREPAMHPTAVAHAGLTTTPTDLARFTLEVMRSHRGESEALLSRAMTEQLLRRQCDIDPDVFGLPLSEGLGVILKGNGTELSFAHPGSNLPGLNCWLIGTPARGAGAVIMTNAARGELLAMEIYASILQEYRER